MNPVEAAIIAKVIVNNGNFHNLSKRQRSAILRLIKRTENLSYLEEQIQKAQEHKGCNTRAADLVLQGAG